MGLMGFGRQERFYGINGAEDLIPTRTLGGSRQAGAVVVTNDKALRHSVVWACTALHAGLLSTFPIDQFRDVSGIRTEWPYKPPILTDPGGMKVDIVDWMSMTQRDLEMTGNTVGLITSRNTSRNKYYKEGLPNSIELQPASACSYVKRSGHPDRWRIGGKLYAVEDVYHERANPIAGFELGLPTVLYAALNIGEALSMQDFGLNWFGNGGIPKARMRNTAKRLNADGIATAKQWYADTVQNGDLLVTGADWEYDLIQGQQAGMEFIDGRKLSDAAVCRYFNTPGDLVDVGAQGASITYANITQRNLEFLILHLGPSVQRREKALTKLLPQPRYVKLNTDALLRMDPQTRALVLKTNIDARLTTNTEARELDDKRALTPAQIAEFETIYGPPKSAITAGGNGGASDGAATDVAVGA